MADPFLALSRAAEALSSHPDKHVREISTWLSLGGRGDLGEWLGVENGVGRPWRRAYGFDQRNRVLRNGARRHFPNTTPGERARRMAKALDAYRETEWRSTCIEASCPHAPDSLPATLWQALKFKDAALGEQQVFRILTGTR